MRLLMVNSAWPQSWGGGEKWFVEAVRWFSARGHDVRLVGRPHSRLCETARSLGFDVRETVFGGDFDPLAVLRAREIIAEFRPDLIVVNFNKEACQFGFAAKARHLPLVARHGFPLFKNRFHHRLLLKHFITRLIVNAADLREEYRRMGFPTDEVDVILNGTAVIEQRRGELRKRFQIAPDDLLILAAGRLESQKKFNRVIEIVEALLPGRPTLRCLIAGEGPLRDELESQIRAKDLSTHIRFAGFVHDLSSVCGDADLFLLTSDQEGTPNVLLEVMAAGVPCVSFAVGSVPEILTGNLSANVIEPGDVQAMTRWSAALLDNPELRAAMSRDERRKVESDLSLNASMSQYEKVFEKVIQSLA
ncbi:glycosyltransferase [candidate division KSB1 bacterium]|nr:MAG: glycosyltransferase [candidate division KSB1 bacterium]